MLDRYIARFKSDQYHFSIDLLRGVAALMVVLYHFLAIPGRFSDFWALQKVASFGHFGVQVFFVISGFVIPNAMYNSAYELKYIGRFMLKRLTRLEPPYIISIIICIALAYISLLSPYYKGKAPEISLPQVLLHLGYLNIYFKYDWLNVVYWSLAIEFQFYLLIALLFPLIVSNKKQWMILLWIAIGVASFFIKDTELIFRHAPFFFFGIALFLFKRDKISRFGFLLFLLINSIYCFYIGDESHVLFGLGTSFVILFTEIRNSVSIFLGSISYSLYLLHVPIGQRMINISKSFINSQFLLLLFVVFIILLMLLISYFYFLMIEKPSQTLSKRISLHPVKNEQN